MRKNRQNFDTKIIAILKANQTIYGVPPKNNKTNPFLCNSNTNIPIQGFFHFSMWITIHL